MFSRSVPNRQKSQGTSMVKKVLFIASILIAVFCYYQIMNGQAKTHSISGELMLGQTQIKAPEESTFSQVLIKYFGGFTYIFPLLIIYVGYIFFLKNFKLKDLDLFKLSIKILGFNLSIIGFCSIFSSMFTLSETGGGGILGDYINILFKSILGGTLYGALSLLVSAIGVCLLLSVNPLFVTDLLGSKVSSALKKNDKNESEDTSAKAHEEPLISPVKMEDMYKMDSEPAKEETKESDNSYNNPLFDSNDVVLNKNQENLNNNFNNNEELQGTTFDGQNSFPEQNNYDNQQVDYQNNYDAQNNYQNQYDMPQNNINAEANFDNQNAYANQEQNYAYNNAPDESYVNNQEQYAYQQEMEAPKEIERPSTLIRTNENVGVNNNNNDYYESENNNYQNTENVVEPQQERDHVVYETRTDLEDVEIDPNDTRQSTFIVDREAILDKHRKLQEEKERLLKEKLLQEQLEQERLERERLERERQQEKEMLEDDNVVHTVIKENNPFSNKEKQAEVKEDLSLDEIVQNEQSRALDSAINNRNKDESIEPSVTNETSVDLSSSSSDLLNNEVKNLQKENEDSSVKDLAAPSLPKEIEENPLKAPLNPQREPSIAMPKFANEEMAALPSAQDNVFTRRLDETHDEGEVIDFEFEKEQAMEPIEIKGNLNLPSDEKAHNKDKRVNVQEEVKPLISEKDAKYSYTNASRGVFNETESLGVMSNNTSFGQNTNTQQNIDSYQGQNNVSNIIDKSSNLESISKESTYPSFNNDNVNYEQGEAIAYESKDVKENRDFYDERDNRESLNVNTQNSQTSNYPSYMSDPNVGGNVSSSQVPLSTTVKVTRGYIGSRTTPKKKYDDWRPSIELLTPGPARIDANKEELDAMASKIDAALRTFNVKAKVAQYLTGPVITRYDLLLEPGVRSSTISNLSVDICRMLMVPNVRVIEFIPGTPYVGIEIPNTQRQMITFYDVASKEEFTNSNALLPICLGCSVTGKPVVADLAAAPHLIVAGTTGSGKSVGLNTILISLLLKKSPAELRLLLIDPKRIEFSLYDNLPHLITPIITDVAEKSAAALNWCVDEMERRYNLLDRLGVRKYEEYNNVIKEANARGEKVMDPQWDPYSGTEQEELLPLPLLVIVVEEYADLILQTTGGGRKKSDNSPETAINRLAAKARAAGMHLILATQSPRADVVTSVIKTNMPSRMAFTVQSGIDSRIILDEAGAEKLLGKGDMLMKFTGVNQGAALRTHGAFLPNEDISRVVDAWIEKGGSPEYIEGVDETIADELAIDSTSDSAPKLDEKFDQAAKFAREYYAQKQKYPPISDFQTMLGVGYPRAKKLVQQLTREGVLSD